MIDILFAVEMIKLAKNREDGCTEFKDGIKFQN